MEKPDTGKNYWKNKMSMEHWWNDTDKGKQKIQHCLARNLIQNSAVRSRRLTGTAMARLAVHLVERREIRKQILMGTPSIHRAVTRGCIIMLTEHHAESPILALKFQV